MVWTSDRVDSLVELWSQGLSARQIAERLGGVTRNAVIGKAYRLKLQRAPASPAPAPPPPPVPDLVLPVLPMSEVKGWMCRWPLDEPGRHGLHICGKTVQPGRHYCAEHLTAAYLMRKRSAA